MRIKIFGYCLLATILYYVVIGVLDYSFLVGLEYYFGVEYSYLGRLITMSLAFVGLVVFFKWKSNVLLFSFQEINYGLLGVLLVLSASLRIMRDPIIRAHEIIGTIPQDIQFYTYELKYQLFFILTTVILTPLVEELFFRGLILQSLSEKYSSYIIPILLSSILFALVHLNPLDIPSSTLQITSTFIFGLVVSLIYLKTKNIFLCLPPILNQ